MAHKIYIMLDVALEFFEIMPSSQFHNHLIKNLSLKFSKQSINSFTVINQFFAWITQMSCVAHI